MLNKEYLERKLAKLEKEKERLEQEAAFLKKAYSFFEYKRDNKTCSYYFVHCTTAYLFHCR